MTRIIAIRKNGSFDENQMKSLGNPTLFGRVVKKNEPFLTILYRGPRHTHAYYSAEDEENSFVMGKMRRGRIMVDDITENLTAVGLSRMIIIGQKS